MTPKYFTKRNRMTAYALSCGYVEMRIAKDGAEVKLDSIVSDGQLFRVRAWTAFFGMDTPRYFRSIVAARRYFDRTHNITKRG